MKQLLGWKVLSVVIVTWWALGTAQETAKNYFDLNELGDVPGVVKVATNYLTIIEFEGHEVEDAGTARSDLYAIEISDNIIRIRANEEVINTDLYARVAGRTVLFKLEGDPETSTPRRYVVRDLPPPQRDIQAFSNPGGDARPPSAEEQPLFPQGLLFEADLFQPRQHEIVIQYRLINESTHPIVNDPFRLRVYYGDTSVRYNKNSSPTAGRPNYLSPGEAEYGQIVIPQAPVDLAELELEWTLIEVGPGTQHRLVRNLAELATGRPSLGISRAPVLPAQADAAELAIPETATAEAQDASVATDSEPQNSEDEEVADETGSSVINGSFEDGDGGWRMWLAPDSDAAATGQVKNGEYCADVTASGSKDWHVRFVSDKLALREGRTYLLRFDAYADKPVYLDSGVILSEAPWTDYAWQSSIMNAAKTTYEHSFALEQQEEVLLLFLMGYDEANAPPYRVCFDNVRLVDTGSAENVAQAQPEQGQEATGLEAAGETTESETKAVPTAVGTSATGVPLVSSDFEGVAGADAWRLKVNDAAEAVRTDEGGEACVTVTGEGEKRWHVSFQQLDLALKQGSYTFSFDAYADKPVSIGVEVSLQKEPWTSYDRHYDTLQTEAESYRYTFEMPQDEPEGRVRFNLGGEQNAGQPPYTVCLDNLRLVHSEAQNVSSNDGSDAGAGEEAQTEVDEGSNAVALFVVDTDKESQIDAGLVGRLESLGYSVTVKDDEEVALPDAEGKAVIVVSASIGSDTIDATFRDTPVPLVTFEEQLFSKLGMTGPEGGTDFEEVEGQTRVRVLLPDHPLSAGLSAEVAVSAGPANVAWGVPAAGATIVAALPAAPDKAVVFAYETDAQMVDGTAPARRVGLFHDYEDATYNENGWALFDAAVRWAADGTASASGASASGTDEGAAEGEATQGEGQEAVSEATSELLLSSSFEEGDDAWRLQTWEGAEARGDTAEGEYCVTIDNTGTETWQIGLQTHELPLQAGRDYTLTWSGRSERPVIINSRFLAGAEPWSTYKNWETTLGSLENSFSHTFTAEADDPSAILEFQMGADYSAGELPVRLCFDDVALEVSGGATEAGATSASFTSALTVLNSQLCLDVPEASGEDGVELVQWDCADVPNQRFAFRPVEGVEDTFFVVSEASDKCLTVADSSLENGARVQQARCDDAENQQFALQPLDQGFRLTALHSGKCLDISEVSLDAGAPLQQYSCHGDEKEKTMGNQTFLLGGKP